MKNENRILELLAELLKKYDRHDERLDKHGKMLENLEQKIGGVENKLDGVENKLDGVENKIVGVVQKQDRHEELLQLLIESQVRLDNSFDQMRRTFTKRFDQMEVKNDKMFDYLQTVLDQHDTRVKRLEDRRGNN